MVLSGAVQIPNNAVKKVVGPEIFNRIIDKDAASRLFQIDLKTLGKVKKFLSSTISFLWELIL